MLAEPNLKLFRDLVSNASRDELIWMNGFLAGLMQSASPAKEEPTAVAAVQVKKITITYGTETGNAKKVATQFAAVAKKKGITVKLSGLDQYRLTDLSKEEYLFTVVSTQGDGEPPATAKKFYDYIHQQDVQLGNLKFGVLGLGDTSYPLFCKTAEDVDGRLEKLGGKRVLALQKCDTDYEQDAQLWFEKVLQTLASAGGSSAASSAAPKKSSHKKIYTGSIATNINLNDRDSKKETYHVEIATDEEVDYQPGDAIGIVPHNKKQWVEAILTVTGMRPDYEVTYKDITTTAEELLWKRLNIVHLSERVVAKYAQVTGQEIPATRIDLVDLLKIYPVKDVAQFEEVIGILESIVPRLYSISSSPAAHSGEVHVTVARDCFPVNDEKKYGLCSDFLSQLEVGNTLDFYIHKNNQFRLPAEDKDVIMVGPGTGIAPFRSFIAERDAAGASGRNWLFFGEQHFVSDFLYQTEIQNYVQTGVLHKVSLAFSRDQQQKIYVQHRMQQQAAELWQWLSEGAYVYVCGAKAPMSIDVEQALLDVIVQQGNKTAEEAAVYLEQLSEEGRYLKDVY
ncbi:sulfite reductase (NADPH) flavoprotein alpha-component [Filimonas lacunae]|uniref:assimilatory sulfite reductase (NADPH) n=1 Tax=Filimonas lacunae TaxID=477680 RepID=A0A173MMX2_9BACT|nr:flavodoxin domain-containing protein [Filimonas lacunae]BAV08800.1 sulfite reductase [NADPH] flavoprotein alpha-component [Filimonas lacunae]SIS61942.1 sulfite reductase (NADPH) flavoprotein alpha-component [Filimonas lacunae]